MAKAFDQRAELAQQRAKRARLIQRVAITATLAAAMVVAIIVWAKQPAVEFEDGADEAYSLSVQSGSAITLFNRIISFDKNARIEVSALGYITQLIDLKTVGRGKYIDVFMPLAPVSLMVQSTEELESPSWFVNDEWLSSDESLAIELKPGSYTLKVGSLFTEDLIQEITLIKAQDNTLKVSPSPVLGSLVIESSPSGAEVVVNDDVKGATPLQLSLEGGRVQLELRKDKYVSQFESIEISALAPHVERNYRLRPGTNGVRLSLSPSGGTLLVNGRPLDVSRNAGVTNVEVPKTGTAKVSYSKPGYSSKALVLSPADSSASISLDKTFGELAVESNVPAQVFINNEAKGSTPLSLQLQTLNYQIVLKKLGFGDERKQVSVKANQTVKAVFEMTTLKEASLRQSPPRVTNSLGMTLMQFMPKSFVMGAPRSERGQKAHEIQRKVEFDRHIYVSTHEVTEAAFAVFKGKRSTVKTPVRNVSWDEAALFCNWLSQKEGLPLVYTVRNGRVVDADLSSTGYRLPTEAEWEWLAKAGGKAAPTIFVWGNQYQIPEGSGNLADVSAKGKASVFLSDYSDGFAELAPIGSYDAERSGMFDMVGNVSEWVHDSYSRTPSDSDVSYLNYAGPRSMNAEHVIKGSNYLSESWAELRASMRLAFRAGNDTTGFRIARYVY
ncbi:MAG TPA: hypothetical protein DCW52_01720 [Gammaproteobacteria bacterium]|mgnify:CR=1 FL=1|nr:hypothetical protein [Gammaproteobacteria bacterium]